MNRDGCGGDFAVGCKYFGVVVPFAYLHQENCASTLFLPLYRQELGVVYTGHGNDGRRWHFKQEPPPAAPKPWWNRAPEISSTSFYSWQSFFRLLKVWLFHFKGMLILSDTLLCAKSALPHIQRLQVAAATQPNPPTQPNPTQPNPTQPNSTQPNPTQPNPTQPNPTQPNPPTHARTHARAIAQV